MMKNSMSNWKDLLRKQRELGDKIEQLSWSVPKEAAQLSRLHKDWASLDREIAEVRIEEKEDE